MSHPNRERADRILDAAGELLLRMGYRKVAIDDIARAVGIGKGTVYLHWRNKELLFQALMMRESADLTDEILAAIKADPAMILPHRMISASFLTTHRRPLVMAMLRGNAEDVRLARRPRPARAAGGTRRGTVREPRCAGTG